MHATSLAMPALNAPGDRQARLGALFDDHERRLYRLARRLTSDTEAARDLVQDTFVRASSGLDTIPTDATGAEAWLVRVLVNLCRDRWRRADVRRRAAAHGHVAATAPANPESAFVARQAVWAAVESLAPRRRAIVVLHHLDGESVSTIATLLGISRVTVRWHLSRGRRELRDRLASTAGDER